MNTKINIDDIMKIGGNNPLLLSHFKGSSDIGEYSRSVVTDIQSFLQNNTLCSDATDENFVFTQVFLKRFSSFQCHIPKELLVCQFYTGIEEK